MKTRILTIRFSNELAAHELPLFRGAVIAALDHKLTLFHNHQEGDGGGFRFAYPLIQYKIIGGKAVIVCIEAGTEAIGEFFASQRFAARLGDRDVELEVADVRSQQFNVQVWNAEFRYRLRRWAPLNAANYERYRHTDSLADRCAMLERILTANILSMAKGIGLQFSSQVVCRISHLSEPYMKTAKGVRMQCFDVLFTSNVSLPSGIGLGKHASINFGVLSRQRNTQND